MKIKNSCGGQGCEIRKIFLPQGIVKDIKKPILKPIQVKKAA
jgi:hypothetical protein